MTILSYMKKHPHFLLVNNKNEGVVSLKHSNNYLLFAFVIFLHENNARKSCLLFKFFVKFYYCFQIATSVILLPRG